MAAKALVFFALFSLTTISAFSKTTTESPESDSGLVLNFYEASCPQAEDIIRQKVKHLYKDNKNTAFSWLRNIFHDCAVESCDASLLLDSTRTVSEKETDKSFGVRNFMYLETIKEAVERECPGVVSCADILVLSGRDGIVELGGPYIPLKTGRRDGKKSRADILEQHLPDHNDNMTVVLERFKNIGIDGSHIVSAHCVKLVHRLYLEVHPNFNSDHVGQILKKCPDAILDRKAVQYVQNDQITPMILDNNYYKNILDNKGLLIVDHQLAIDQRTKPYVKKMAKSQDYFFKQFRRAITILTENNPLIGNEGEIRKQCNVANRHH